MIKKIQAKGSFNEIGEIHGRLGKKEVMRSLETYESLFHAYSQISWNIAREHASRHLESIHKYDPDLISEMEGVAKGAGVDFEDILVLNSRSEIALANYKNSGKIFNDGCTAIGVTSPISDDTIIGQNWDWKGTQAESLLFLEIEQAHKPTVKMITEGGIIGKIGSNSSGIGVCLNALLTNRKNEQIPIHLGLRSVLNSNSLHEAISKIKDGQIASSANFLIGSYEGKGKGMVANLEVSPFGIDIMGGSDGRVVHTNHICSSKILNSGIEDRNEYIFEDSMVRKSRAELLLNSKITCKENIGEDSFMEIFSDTFNYPNSICHYANQNVPEHRRMETVFSVIMNLSKNKILLCVGKPSEANYIEL